MGRAPCCSKVGLKKGVWTLKEDSLLVNYIQTHGQGHWNSLPKKAGLLRCGKSCRLRWVNYLRPDIKRGNISADEEDLIIRLHSLLGNRWSLIAGRLPGRTDNEIKNHWNSRLSKKLSVMNLGTHAARSHTATKGTNNGRHLKKKNSKTATDIVFMSDSPSPGDNNETMITHTKVHRPIAIRVSVTPSKAPLLSYGMARNKGSSSDNYNTSRIKQHEEEEKEEEDYENIMIKYGCDLSLSYSWHIEHDDLFFPNNMDNVIIDATATASRKLSNSNKSSEEQTLGKIFEEYQELLGADQDYLPISESFVDSLLV